MAMAASEPPAPTDPGVVVKPKRRLSENALWTGIAVVCVVLAWGLFLGFPLGLTMLGDSLEAQFDEINNQLTPGYGLEFDTPTPRRDVRNGVDYVIVEGEVFNPTEDTIELPWIRVALTSQQGVELTVKYFRSPKAEVEPGEAVNYKVEFKSPPRDARKALSTFVSNSEAEAANIEVEAANIEVEAANDEAGTASEEVGAAKNKVGAANNGARAATNKVKSAAE